MAFRARIKGEKGMQKQIRCPSCNSTKIVDCPEGTNLKPVPDIQYICEECLYEFGGEGVKSGIQNTATTQV